MNWRSSTRRGMQHLHLKVMAFYSLVALTGLMLLLGLGYAGMRAGLQSTFRQRATHLTDELSYSFEALAAVPADTSALMQRLTVNLAALEEVTSVAVVGLDGVIRADSIPSRIGLPAPSPWVGQVLASQVPVEVETGMRTVFVRPLHNAASQAAAILWVEMDMTAARAAALRDYAGWMALGGGLWLVLVAVAYQVTQIAFVDRLRPVEHALRRATSGDLSAHVSVRPLWGGADEIDHLAGQFNAMVATLHRQQQELRSERDAAQLIMQHMGQGLTVSDAEGCFLYVNPAFAHMVQRAPETLIGVNPRELTHPGDVALLEQARQDRQAHKTTTYETRLLAADGHAVQVQITGSPRLQNGRYVGAIAVVTDVTERARLEQMKSDFVNRAAHELRTPLTTSILISELIHDGGTPEEMAEYWTLLEAEFKRQRSLIEQLLTLGRIESGSLHMKLQPLDVPDSMNEAVQSITALARTKSLDFQLETEAVLPRILGDKVYLPQVFVNLLSNAIKFTPAGGRIEVRITHRENGVQVEVQDSGIGIPAQDQPYLFERFYRATNATRNEVPGTGVGLFIVKSIVTQSGGRLSLESEVGRGTTFRLWWPGYPVTA